MAKVEPTDIHNTLGASLGGVQTDTNADAVARGITVLGGALDRLGDETNRAVAIVARGYNQRANERVYLEGQQDYWAFESDLLRGKDGVLLRRAEDFEGTTLETTQRLSDHAKEYASKMGTGPGRDAFIEFAAKEIARTRDQVGAAEAENLEGLRVSQAGAALTTRMQKTIIEQPNRFLPQTRPDGTVSYADPELIREAEQNLEMINRGWSDEEISSTTKQMIAESAYKSVFAQLDLSPNRVPIARQIQESYESLWTPAQRESVKKRIVDEGAYSAMDGIVAGSYSAVLASDSTPSEMALRDHAAAVFKADFKARNGYAAPDEMVQEIKRRASTDLSLRLGSDKQAHAELRGGQMTNLVKLIAAGSKPAIQAEVNRLMADANGEDDTQFAEWLLQIHENVTNTGTGFPKESTEQGKEMLLRGTGGMSRADIMAAKPFMSVTDFTAFAGPAFGLKGSVPDKGSLEEALNSARNITKGLGPYTTTVKGDKSGVFATRYQQLLELSQRFFETNQKVPDREELRDIAVSLELSADDAYVDLGYSGTLGEFLRNPSEHKLSLKDSKDKALVATALMLAQANPQAFVALGGAQGVDFGTMTVDDLVKNPALVGQLLEYGLLTNAPLGASVRGASPVRFREWSVATSKAKE